MKTEKLKQYFADLKNLMLPFKWYIAAYLFAFLGTIHEYFFPPAADDPIWGAEAMRGDWNYANQALYIESIKMYLVIDVLVFLLGTSNMRNHPRIAKLIFLSPWLSGLCHMILIMLGIEEAG